MNKKLLFLFSLFFSLSVFSQNNFWRPVSSKNVDETVIPKRRVPAQFQTYEIDLPAIQNYLSDAPLMSTKHSDVTFNIPDEKGIFHSFKIYRSGTLSPELQNNAPIDTYRGYAKDGAIASIVISPFGLHAGVLRSGKTTLILETSSRDQQEIIVFGKDQLAPIDFQCFTDTPVVDESLNLNQVRRSNDQILRTYRFAIGTTGEYSQYHVNRAINLGIIGNNATDAQKKNVILAAVAVTVDRLNTVYERDFGISLELVSNEKNAIYLNPNTDPYDNSDIMSMLNANTGALNTAIGANNYDGGHLFTTYQGGGISGLGVICTSEKGRSVTGSTQPIGDAYDIDYVAHEVGHAFGCNHTFGNSCANNRSISTSVEPGSGSTIMAYAGVCSPNVQLHSDDYFHIFSITECYNFVSTTATCSTNTNIGNHTPVINVVNYGNVYIPKKTPFVLTAVGVDADANDALTYCWEQIDIVPNNSNNWVPNATHTGGPEFRSYDPTTNNSRYFPRTVNIFNNTYRNTWEVLPEVNRTLSFAITVRDNHPGGGQSPFDYLQFNVDQNSGPFRITNMTSGETWQAGQTKTITWNVAGTDGGLVNCATLDILFSADNGTTFPYVVATNIPNNGSAQFTVPNNENTNLGRFMLKAHNNYFFDMAHGRFTIQGAGAVVKNNLDNLQIYPNPAKHNVYISFDVKDLSQPVQISLFDLSGRQVLKQNFDPVEQFNQNINLEKMAKGIYFIRIKNGENNAAQKLIIE